MKLRPLHDRVVIRRLEGDDKTKGGIIIPDTAQEKPIEGEVLAVGPGARDGLTTGLAARGHAIRVVRTSIELTVLLCGWALGGTVGIGTVLYAVAIGPITHWTIPGLMVAARVR